MISEMAHTSSSRASGDSAGRSLPAWILLGLVASCGGSGSTFAQTPPGPAPTVKSGSPGTGKSTGLAFEVAYPSVVKDRALSARVYVLLAKGGTRLEPRFGPDWFRPQPFFSMEVTGWKPGQTVRIDAGSVGFPGPLDTLEPGEYAAQAVVRLNPDTHSIGTGEGNAYGPVVQTKLSPEEPSTVKLEVDKLVAPRKFQETDSIKLAELPSPLLSKFHGRPIKHRAAVILPAGKPARKLPAVYVIPGFGGDHYSASRMAAEPRLAFAQELVRIVLDPDCGTGHHVFADSATNGPRGQALVEEFIPYLERTFPLVAKPGARLLNGHSSGGWSSLWLQVTYPDFFGGTWSTSPDPVDFRDFQRIDIYASGENMFHDREGKNRPIARMGVVPVLFYDRFSRMEEAMGPGGQLGSFEAVFSPRRSDGQPRKLWDRRTGAIDPEVARAWEAYDIRLVLERNWPIIGPRLRGKIHVITGGTDTFYLEGATKLLKEALAKLQSDAVVEIIPGRDHSTVLDRELAKRLDREMTATVSPFLDPKGPQAKPVASAAP
jgi:pimeloyl-ACP methyl ester carboxylesterase